MSVISQMLIIQDKPMAEPQENTMALFNEVMVFLYLLVLITLTDYNSVNPYREICGLLLLGVVSFSILANFTNALY
jgi:hypothetical protein